jgi:hypothetical protein
MKTQEEVIVRAQGRPGFRVVAEGRKTPFGSIAEAAIRTGTSRYNIIQSIALGRKDEKSGRKWQYAD